jgi:hypothetical protein
MELLGTGNFLRSAEMDFVSLILAEHLAHDVLAKLGEVGTVQFTDVRVSLVVGGAARGRSPRRFPPARKCPSASAPLPFPYPPGLVCFSSPHRACR